MAGYYENKDKGSCWEAWFDGNNQTTVDRTLDVKAWMRPNVTQARSNALANPPSFYGPKNVPRTTQESFLQGRGQINSDQCPECDVIYLPESVFPKQKPFETSFAPGCQNNALTSAQTRQKRSCYNIQETDITQYQFMPSNFQVGYLGFNVLCNSTNIQDRENGRTSYVANFGPETKRNVAGNTKQQQELVSYSNYDF
jgi:hypothetical protein